MKILILTNKRYVDDVPLQSYLQHRGHEVGYAVHPVGPAILKEVDLAIGFFYPHILRQVQLDAPTYGVMNVHQSLLPYGRGAYPAAFAILDGTPAGVTIHWMERKVDTGNILYQVEVGYGTTATAGILYDRLERESHRAFETYWPEAEMMFVHGMRPTGIPQTHRDKKANTKADLDYRMDLEEQWRHRIYDMDDVIDVLRAGTFMDKGRAYFKRNGRRYNVRIELD